MNMRQKPPQQLSVRDLLREEANYVIPMYQRNYAWGEKEITQLVRDVIDYLPRARPYYIGTLVVFERNQSGMPAYETIDGQQRMTTLSLLVAHLRNNGIEGTADANRVGIRFESRERSQRTLDAVFSGAYELSDDGGLQPEDENASIVEGYRLIKRILAEQLKASRLDIGQFAGYLLDRVMLMRVAVPVQTDLNHYFEVMNSRGEQLEKHEVLKARLMAELDRHTDAQENQACLHAVWEACANMERYVQVGFTPAQRDSIFGQDDWGCLSVSSFDELSRLFVSQATGCERGPVNVSLEGILSAAEASASSRKLKKEEAEERQAEETEVPERFHGVINFPNFLLQVLRVMTREDVPLDDKNLLDAFDLHVLHRPDPVTHIKSFIFALLRCKFLFDHYVIKREFSAGKDCWSLKRLICYKRPGFKQRSVDYRNSFGIEVDADGGRDVEGAGQMNRRILMLQAAFHVSTPTLAYKHWLSAALDHLFRAGEVQESNYLAWLESVAQTFVFDRYVRDDGREYYDMIYTGEGKCQALAQSLTAAELSRHLVYGEIANNFVFNYLDYLLWIRERAAGREPDQALVAFEFTFRSSVEHFYPRNPMDGAAHLEEEALDSFGNLCLISHSKNSRLSNFSPGMKAEHYLNNDIDSIKQHLMMKAMKDAGKWDESVIQPHGAEMVEVLIESLAASQGNSRGLS